MKRNALRNIGKTTIPVATKRPPSTVAMAKPTPMMKRDPSKNLGKYLHKAKKK